jgi:hypothetical protein
MARTRKQPKDIDVSRFEPLVEEALKAFSVRFHYALNMLDRASSVENKRAKFKQRKLDQEE